MVIDQDTKGQQSLNQLLLQNTRQTILFNSQNEFSKLIEQLDGNEDLLLLSEHFFKEGYLRLSSEKSLLFNDLIVILTDGFTLLVDNFEMYIQVEVKNDFNVTVKVGQLIRFINFIQAIKKSDINDVRIKYLIENIEEIKEYIFNNNIYMRPHAENWSQQFKNLEHRSYNQKIGYEPYYTTGVVEIIRTISNKKRHIHAFPRKFNTKFNFYNDFHQMIGVYNLALYSFIELIEAWVSVKSFIDNHLKQKI